MADFKTAYYLTMQDEGGYSNRETDYGGETYKGISRRFNPGWHGWIIIDLLKRESVFPENLDQNPTLQTAVFELYKDKYWDVFAGDDIPDKSLGNELFDQQVNLGPRTIEHLQRALNVLNSGAAYWSDLVVDGKFGPKTFQTVLLCLAHPKRGSRLLVNTLNILQGAFYISQMEKDPSQEDHVGWLNRVEVVKCT